MPLSSNTAIAPKNTPSQPSKESAEPKNNTPKMAATNASLLARPAPTA